MIPDKFWKELAAHAKEKTGGACLQVLEESCRKESSFLPRQIHSNCHCSCKLLLREDICIHILSIKYIIAGRTRSATRSRNRPGTPAAQRVSGCISIRIVIQWGISIPTVQPGCAKNVLSFYFECRKGLYGFTVSIEYRILYWI